MVACEMNIWNHDAGQFEVYAEWMLHCCDYTFPRAVREQINAQIDARTAAAKAARELSRTKG